LQEHTLISWGKMYVSAHEGCQEEIVNNVARVRDAEDDALREFHMQHFYAI